MFRQKYKLPLTKSEDLSLSQVLITVHSPTDVSSNDTRILIPGVELSMLATQRV